MRWNHTAVIAALLISTFSLTGPTPAVAQGSYNRLCDPGYENCRAPLLELIRHETVGIDVAFWFMEDTRYASELIRRHQAGVPVRVVVDSDAWLRYGYTAAEEPVRLMRDAGIPMREKTGSAGILHFKMFLFAGQGVVEFSGANFSDAAFVYRTPYADYVDEVIAFSDEPSIVDSFKTRYDDIWTDQSTGTQSFANYANISGALTRTYPTYTIDPELNFVPWNSFASRSTSRYRAETVGIDAIMYRITDRRHTDAMIEAEARGVPVRLIHEQLEYRNPGKLWNAWNVDRLYMAGIEIRNRGHLGLSHEKLTVLRGQAMAILGSSNWTSASSAGQHEHNIFSTRPWIYDWSADHFDRKWYNLGPSPETEPFTPLPPDAPLVRAPADAAQGQPLSVTLRWFGGLWAHKYDLYFGTDPTSLTRLLDDVELGPSESSGQAQTHQVGGLAEGTTYYWRVVSRTMANLARTGPVWSFRTQGAPPASGGGDVVLWAARAPSASGWSPVADSTAAGGSRLANPNLGAPKPNGALASPQAYFEMGFTAAPGVPYRLWIRGKATSNNWNNDSVFVQFSDSATASGAAQWRIGTTSAATVTIEDCSGCGLSNWGWNDTAIGVDVLGPLVYFEAGGTHTLRVQVREDGLSIDQIILSPGAFLTTRPGQARDDGTVFAEQNGAALDGNDSPSVSLTAPANGYTRQVPGVVRFEATASDGDGSITRVEFLANGTVVGSDTTSPYGFDWDATAPGSYSVQARATDNRNATATSPARTITLTAGSTAAGHEIVLYASTGLVHGRWSVVADPSAAEGERLQNPDAGEARQDAQAAPADYFELTFDARAGRPYHLWLRGRATGNSWRNDSVYVQFSGAVTASGSPVYRIGTTSAAAVTLEGCTGCGVSGWGWNDNQIEGLGPAVYFGADGPQTVRVQVREDGLGVDHVVLSSVFYLDAAPGADKNDVTILPATP